MAKLSVKIISIIEVFIKFAETMFGRENVPKALKFVLIDLLLSRHLLNFLII